MLYSPITYSKCPKTPVYKLYIMAIQNTRQSAVFKTRPDTEHGTGGIRSLCLQSVFPKQP